MNKIIRSELEKSNLEINIVNDNTLLIPRQIPPKEIEFQIDHYYIIQLADYILHPYKGFDLQDKWNKGIIPKSEVMKCQLKMVMGKMIKIDGCGFDNINDIDGTDYYYGLWLPRNGVKIIKEI